MISTEIAHDQWPLFCIDFSRQHRGWLANTSALDQASRISPDETHPAGGHPTARGLPFSGLEPGPRQNDFVMELGDGNRHVTEPIRDVTRICMLESDEGAHVGLRIDRSNDTAVLLTFRVAARPETVDGIAASEW